MLNLNQDDGVTNLRTTGVAGYPSYQSMQILFYSVCRLGPLATPEGLRALLVWFPSHVNLTISLQPPPQYVTKGIGAMCIQFVFFTVLSLPPEITTTGIL